jgi:tetratricopeptide (TPR) repeat protein
VYACFLTGRVEEALDWADRAISAGRAEPGLGVGVLPDNADPLAWALMIAAGVHAHAGDLDQARSCLDESMQRARAAGAAEISAYADAIRGLLADFGEEPGAALAAAEQSSRFAERAGNIFARVSALHSLGIALVANGRAQEALVPLERAIALQRERNTGREYEPWTLAKLAEARLACGDSDGALAAAQGGVTLAAERGMRPSEVWGCLALGRVLLARGAPGAEVSAALERGLRVSREIGTKGIEPQLHAELAALAGRDPAPGSTTLY